MAEQKKLQSIKVGEIATLPECGLSYARGGVSDSHVNDLAVTYIDGRNGGTAWPFADHLVVMRLTEPVKGDGGKMTKVWESGRRYVTVVGNHRLLAIRKVNDTQRAAWSPVDTIPVDVRAPMTTTDMIVEQLLSDLTHGLKLSVEQREENIRDLVKVHGMKQERVAKLFHLNQSSVSRIVAGKQSMKQMGLVAKATKRGKKGATQAKKGKKGKGAKTYDPYTFLDGLAAWGADGIRHRKPIEAALKTKGGKKFSKTLATLLGLFEAFEKLASAPLAEKKAEAADTKGE